MGSFFPLSLQQCLVPQDPEVDILCEGFSLELGRVVIPLRLLYTVIKQGHALGNLKGSGVFARFQGLYMRLCQYFSQ